MTKKLWDHCMFVLNNPTTVWLVNYISGRVFERHLVIVFNITFRTINSVLILFICALYIKWQASYLVSKVFVVV